MTEVARYEFDRLNERVERIETAQRAAADAAWKASLKRMDRISWTILGVGLLALYSVFLWDIAVAATEGR
jgi:hypothetical protein